MADYKEFLDSINREAYHAGEYQWEEDGYTVTRTYHYSPPGCHSSCGLLYYVKDGKVEFVEGDPLDPCANGRLCMRCLNRVEAINHPDRLKYPMKRAGERGENKWERITWDEAYDIVERETRKVWEEYGPESILCTKGTARGTVWQLHYFFQAAFKTANVAHIGFTGYACYLPRTCGCIAPMGDFPIVDASQGHPDRYMADEFRPPEVLVVWGNEPLASNADGYIGHWLVQCVQMGSKIISIDPRLTWWGSSRGILAARPSRHRRGAGLRMAERHHQRGPVRSRVRGKVDHGLRRHRRACAGVDGGTRRRDLPDPRGGRHRVGAPVRFGQQLGHPVGPCVRPEHERHGLESGRRRPDGHLREHRHARRLAAGAQRVQRVARFRQRRQVGRPGSRQEKGDHALRVQHRRRGLHPSGRVRSGAALHGDGRAVPHQDVVRPVHQRACLRRHGRAAPVQGTEGNPVHRVRRSFHDAHRRGAGRRGHARGQ